MRGFLNFIREQGVVGLAVGFILGGSIQRVVTAIVNDLVNPALSLVLGKSEGLRQSYVQVGTAKFLWGDLLSALIDFAVIALVVYFGVKLARIDRLDKKKEV